MNFGEALAEERRANGMSQHRLALNVETTQRHISFLETGRSRPTREMILRLSDALELQSSRRADLFESAGFVSPYRRRAPDDDAVLEALKRLERYILEPWPYPALALTETWDVIAANARGKALFQLPDRGDGTQVNLFDIMLAPGFRSGITNWSQVAAVVQSRLRRHVIEHPEFRGRLQEVAETGAFDASVVQGNFEFPVVLPLIFELADGRSFRMTSMTARLTSAQDDFVAGVEIELCVPLDDESASILSSG
ncbi:MAG: helix-turn-helix domain-containing protein [Devosia sp.]|nr:helix-turn-helix domain-containing protein [Devosia sp.]